MDYITKTYGARSRVTGVSAGDIIVTGVIVRFIIRSLARSFVSSDVRTYCSHLGVTQAKRRTHFPSFVGRSAARKAGEKTRTRETERERQSERGEGGREGGG